MPSRWWRFFDVIVVVLAVVVVVDIYQRMVSHDELQRAAPYVSAQPNIEARFLSLEGRVEALEAAR